MRLVHWRPTYVGVDGKLNRPTDQVRIFIQNPGMNEMQEKNNMTNI